MMCDVQIAYSHLADRWPRWNQEEYHVSWWRQNNQWCHLLVCRHDTPIAISASPRSGTGSRAPSERQTGVSEGWNIAECRTASGLRTLVQIQWVLVWPSAALFHLCAQCGIWLALTSASWVIREVSSHPDLQVGHVMCRLIAPESYRPKTWIAVIVCQNQPSTSSRPPGALPSQTCRVRSSPLTSRYPGRFAFQTGGRFWRRCRR